MGTKIKKKIQALCSDKDPGAILSILLGRPGRLVSASKSRGPAMAVYNSNVVVDGEVVWYGDVDLDKDRNWLGKIAELVGSDIEIYYEHDLRVFPFEVADEKEMSKKHKEKMKNRKPVWSTATPELFGDRPYEEVREEMQKVREERVLDYLAYCGILTPGKTEWKWYNTWFYEGPYKIYAYFDNLYQIYIHYPVYFVKTSGREMTRWQTVKEFLAAVKREWNYRHGSEKTSN